MLLSLLLFVACGEMTEPDPSTVPPARPERGATTETPSPSVPSRDRAVGRLCCPGGQVLFDTVCVDSESPGLVVNVSASATVNRAPRDLRGFAPGEVFTGTISVLPRARYEGAAERTLASHLTAETAELARLEGAPPLGALQGSTVLVAWSLLRSAKGAVLEAQPCDVEGCVAGLRLEDGTVWVPMRVASSTRGGRSVSLGLLPEPAEGGSFIAGDSLVLDLSDETATALRRGLAEATSSASQGTPARPCGPDEAQPETPGDPGELSGGDFGGAECQSTSHYVNGGDHAE